MLHPCEKGFVVELFLPEPSQQPNWEAVINAVISDGIDKLLDNIHLEIGIPFAPMLAQPTKGTTSSSLLPFFLPFLLSFELLVSG
jgi:hypothetical protein